jgi:very-long-chain (3R)-3-hydroxyacyl-CoA dehydratase
MAQSKSLQNKDFKFWYLLWYNTIAFVSWATVAFFFLKNYNRNEGAYKNGDLLWNSLRVPLLFAQTLSLLEVANSFLGITPSDGITTMVQVFSRLHIIYFIWRLIPNSRESLAFSVTVAAWTSTELIRYSYYTCQILFSHQKIFLLKWLRYSLFILAYPLGILGEMRCIWVSFSFLRKTAHLRAYPKAMPNFFNFQMDLFLVYCFVFLLYIPGGINLYMHMMNRRAKALRGEREISAPNSAVKQNN